MLKILEWLTGNKKKPPVDSVTEKILSHWLRSETAGKDRCEKRFPIAKGIRVVPYDEKDGFETQRAFDAVTRDWTVSGLSFVYRESFVKRDHLAISLDVDGVRYHFLCEVRHSTNLGGRSYQTGCFIIRQMPKSPEDQTVPEPEIDAYGNR
jgi:hypothetical protein